MPLLKIRLKVVSPLFLNGPDPRGKPELRAASVRGQLRYWFRAIEGTKTNDLQEVWQTEEEIFGSTARGSQVAIRFYFEGEPQFVYQDILPHKKSTSQNQQRNQRQRLPRPNAIEVGQECILEIITRPGIDIPNGLLKALQVWLLLGGLGKRSRRMFGALQIDAIVNAPVNLPVEFDLGKEIIHSEEYVDWAKRTLNWAIGNPSPIREPQFPTLHPDFSRVVVCHQLLDSGPEANAIFFQDLLRSEYYNEKSMDSEGKPILRHGKPVIDAQKLRRKEMFGYTRNQKRLASPLIAQVRGQGTDYFLVFTAMRYQTKHSNGEAFSNNDWKVVDRLMDEVQKDDYPGFQGEPVWKGRLAT